MGISPSVISEWESNKLQIRQPNAMALELLYGVSWRWLMTGEGPMWAADLPDWVRGRLQGQDAATPASPSPAPAAPAPAAALSGEALAQVAQGLAIAQCQAAGTAGDPLAMVEAFKAILGRLQS